MSGVNGGNQDVDIDLGRVISAVWERKGRILGATIVAAALALVGTSLMKPSYKGETRLLIESRSPNLSGGDAAAQANDPLLAQVVDLRFFCGFTFAEIAAMRGLSERTVQRHWEKARLYLHDAIEDAGAA